MNELTKKYQEDLRKALNCAEKGKAYHWPTVAEILADEVKRLHTRPNDAKKWIRVEDELPETGQIVIAFEPHCLNNPDMGMTLVVVDDTFHEVKRHDGKPWVTHWMPAITPPKQSSEGEE